MQTTNLYKDVKQISGFLRIGEGQRGTRRKDYKRHEKNI